MGEVGKIVASKKLTVRSRFNVPGVLAISREAFVCKPVNILKAGRLETLLPSEYVSFKLNLKRVSMRAVLGLFWQPHGWEIDAGKTPLKKIVKSVHRGALVGRFSMGMPAANGDFSAGIKNCFLIENGIIGKSLTETMVTGNMLQMLQNIVQISQERVDRGVLCLPSLRITGMKFS
jgi:PmbA protein